MLHILKIVTQIRNLCSDKPRIKPFKQSSSMASKELDWFHILKDV